MDNIFAFLSYVLITTFTPGPNNIMSMTIAHKYGYKKTLPFSLGVAGGVVVIIAVCVFFEMLLYSNLPKIKFYMAIVGAIYMLYLAYTIVLDKPKENKSGEDRPVGFFSAVMLQFLNPKAVLYGITIASSFIIPYFKSAVMFTVIIIILAFLCALSTTCWALLGAAFQRFLSKYRTAFKIVMALLLVYCAVSVLIE